MLRFIALAAAFLLAGPALAQDATPTRYAVLILERATTSNMSISWIATLTAIAAMGL